MTARFEDRLRACSRWRSGGPPGASARLFGCAVAEAFRIWTTQLMAGAAAHATPRTVDLRKLRLTEGYREALRQAPAEQTALFGIWDAAYRQLERLTWELAPPVIDPPPPPPPPSFEEVQIQYETMKRERERQADARTVQWHPLELTGDPPGDDAGDPLELVFDPPPGPSDAEP